MVGVRPDRNGRWRARRVAEAALAWERTIAIGGLALGYVHEGDHFGRRDGAVRNVRDYYPRYLDRDRSDVRHVRWKHPVADTRPGNERRSGRRGRRMGPG